MGTADRTMAVGDAGTPAMQTPTVGEMRLPRVFSAHLLGGLVVFLFLLEVITGTLLLIYYRPSAGAAYHSVGIITDEVRLGWLVRGLHAWGSDLLILLILLQLVRIYFARAYRGRHRWVWVSGILLCMLALACGFTGGILPWDQFAYWSIDAAHQTVQGMPVLGSALLYLFWGGWELGEEVLIRFYAFHVGIIPLLAVWLLGVHAALLWWSSQGEPAAAGAPSLLDFALDVLIVLLVAYAIVATLAMVFPPVLLDEADPLTPIGDVRPRWYLLPARMLLRHLPGLVAAVVVLGLFALVVSVPWLDRAPRLSRWGRAAHVAAGVAALAGWIFLALRQYVS